MTVEGLRNDNELG
jgi:hypothetical protein